MPVHLYFAYGSNLDAAQMRERCPSARRVCLATLRGHRLAFAGFSGQWGGAVATVVADARCDVSGVVWQIGSTDLPRLDRCEGTPWIYRRVPLYVQPEEGPRLLVWVYMHQAPRVRAALATPALAYVEQIERAYEEHELPKPSALVRAKRRAKRWS